MHVYVGCKPYLSDAVNFWIKILMTLLRFDQHVSAIGDGLWPHSAVLAYGTVQALSCPLLEWNETRFLQMLEIIHCRITKYWPVF